VGDVLLAVNGRGVLSPLDIETAMAGAADEAAARIEVRTFFVTNWPLHVLCPS
jgi:hypothetical protein